MNGKNLMEMLEFLNSFETFISLIESANLDEMLSEECPFTLFAPNDGAFAALPKGMVGELLSEPSRLQIVIQNHILEGKFFEEDLLTLESIQTLSGRDLTIYLLGGEATINDARLVTSDIKATNGIIHIVDTVLLPDKEFE